MAKQCTLEADTFVVTFAFFRVETDSTSPVAEYCVEYTITSETDNRTFVAQRCVGLILDLRYFIDYLETHLFKLIYQGEVEPTYTFLPYSLAFKVLADFGWCELSNAYISLVFMVNIKDFPSQNPNTFIGGAGIVEIKRLRDFVASLRTILSSDFRD